MVGSDSMKVTILGWVVVGASLLACISSVLPWYRVSVSVLGIERSSSMNAWNAGFGAWFSVLALVVAGGLVLASVMVVQPRLAASGPLITLGLSTLALFTILLRWVTFPDAGGGQGDLDDIELNGLLDVSSGAGLGLYLGLIAAITAVAASFLTFRATGFTRQPPHSWL